MSFVRHFLPLVISKQVTGSIWSSSRIGRRQCRILPQITQFDHQRTFHTTGIRSESALAKLRKKTGYAFSMCRKALELHDQDFAKAEKWLRAEAVKQGWEKAQRVKSRSTGEGLVGIYTSPDRLQAAMVEVKCETDFVAKNENFTELASKLAERIAAHSESIHQSADDRDTHEQINKVWIVDENKLHEIAGQLITESIGKLGENIRFVRACIIRIQNGKNSAVPLQLLPYTHAVGGKIPSNVPNVLLGKYGTIVAVQKQPITETAIPDVTTTPAEVEEPDLDAVSSNSLEEIGSKLGQHIIGLSPLTVAPQKTAEIPEITEAQVGDEEPTALLKQKFIFNEDITVEQFLKNSTCQVLDFVRFEVGEEGDKD